MFDLLPRRAPSRPREQGSDALRDKLDEWTDGGLISREQRDAILVHERQRPPNRIPLVSESIGYIGGALVLAAVALLLGRRWDDLSTAARVAALAIPTLVVTTAGWLTGRSREPASTRLAGVLWLLSCAGFAGALTVVFVDAMHDGDPPEHGGLLFVAGLTAAWALAEWWLRREPLQHVALFVAVLLTALGIVNALEAGRAASYSSIVWGLTVWAFGGAWAGLGMSNRLSPPVLARLLGPATVLIGAQIVTADATVFGLWLGAATAASLVGVGVARSALPELIVGTAGIFQWSPQIAFYYLADTLGAEAALFVVGVLLLGAAILLGRAYRHVRAREPIDGRTGDDRSTSLGERVQ